MHDYIINSQFLENKETIFDSCLQNNGHLNTQLENGMTITDKIQ